jgi:hypothetical protein
MLHGFKTHVFRVLNRSDYGPAMTSSEKQQLLRRFSRAEISAVELRRALGDISFADVIIELAALDLPLPRASETGRESQIARAKELFSRSRDDNWPPHLPVCSIPDR